VSDADLLAVAMGALFLVLGIVYFVARGRIMGGDGE
jgi:hypothetical protein